MKKESLMTSKLMIAFVAFICCALWGSAIPMIKTGYGIMGVEASDAASQVLFAGFRFALAGLLVLLFECIRERRVIIPDRVTLKYTPRLAMAQTLGQYFFFYIGVAHSKGVTGGILTGMTNFFAILMSCLIFRGEKMTPRKALGCGLGFLGVVAINVLGGGEIGGFTLLGEGFILISGISSGLSSCLIREYSKKASAVILSGCQFFFGGLVLALLGGLMGGSLQGMNFSALAILIYLAMVSAVAYTLWSILLSYNPVSQVSIFGFINPICCVMFSAVILGEYQQAFNLVNLAALILVCLGIYVVNAEGKVDK